MAARSEHDGPDLAPWEVLGRERVVEVAPWFSVWREELGLPGGQRIDDYYTIEQPDYVVVAAQTQQGQVVALWSYKHGPRRVGLSLAAGHVEAGEQPLEAAKRELLEETGYEAKSWESLGSHVVDGNRGFGSAHVFLARGAELVAPPDSGDLEEMQVELMPLEAMRSHLREGNVSSLGHAVGILLALDALEQQPSGQQDELKRRDQ